MFVNKTGCNTNMKKDGLVGGEIFVLLQDPSPDFRQTGLASNIHYTVLCFLNVLGVLILCAVILKSKKNPTDIPISWKLGIDITKDIKTGRADCEIMQNNFGDAMLGGPRCTYKGKEFPCFVGCSESVGITSEMLAAMLEQIDLQNVFN
jgi:hypothetical protein